MPPGSLGAQYAELARQAVAKLARRRPSALAGGWRGTRAAAVAYALGQVKHGQRHHRSGAQ